MIDPSLSLYFSMHLPDPAFLQWLFMLLVLWRNRRGSASGSASHPRG